MSSEITQLREHIDKRCSSLDEKVDDILTAIRGDGMQIEGIAAKTAKNSHDINGLKFVVPALGDRMTQVEHETRTFKDYMGERLDEKKWRNRAIATAIIAACGTTAVAQITMAVKASNHAEKGQP